jgi:hypothetical protein
MNTESSVVNAEFNAMTAEALFTEKYRIFPIARHYGRAYE